MRNLEEVFLMLMVVLGMMVILRIVWGLERRIKILEQKISTVWNFQLRRAEAELISKHFGERKSPLQLSSRGRAVMEPMRHDLRAFYVGLERDVGLAELALLIEERFGERLVREVCIPYDLQEGACLIVSAMIAMESPVAEAALA